jgi:hypothetical protein
MSGKPYDRDTEDVEQRRRDLKRSDPDLYAYIEALAAARELDRAGGLASGARDNYGAANRVWAEAGRWAAVRDRIRDA